MKVIEWRSWLLDPLKNHLHRESGEEDILWKDPVTNAPFAINRDRYQALLASAEKQLCRCSADEAYALLTSIPYSFGETIADSDLAFHIPYPMNPVSNTVASHVRVRLVDFLLLRTGLYYALFTPDAVEWGALRQELLQVNPKFMSSEIQVQVEAIDRYLAEGIVEERWKDYRLAVVKAGAVKIKDYFLETDKIKEIRGASRLLEEISQQRIPRYVQEVATPESVVYSGGGKMLMVLPAHLGRKAAQEIESLYARVTGSAQAVAYPTSVRWDELSSEHFRDTISWIDWKRTERQLTKGLQVEPEWMDLQSYSGRGIDIPTQHNSLTRTEYLHHLREIGRDTKALLVGGDIPICTSCRLREAQAFYQFQESAETQAERFAYCFPCQHKFVYGNDEAEEDYLQQIRTIASQYRKNLSEAQPVVAHDLDEIAYASRSKDLIAVVYGDGNNMGRVVEGLDSFLRYRYFSIFSDQVTKLAAYTTLLERVNLFEVIAVGGDDVFLVVPGSDGLRVAAEIGRKFDQAMCTYSTDPREQGITISFGVAIGSSRFPFFLLYRSAIELLQSAKKAKKTQKGWKGGSVDFMVQRQSNPFVADLQEYRDTQFSKHVNFLNGTTAALQLLMRPYDFNRVVHIEELVIKLHELRGAKGVIYKICQVLQQLSLEEIKLFYQQFMFSERDRYDQRKEIHQYLTLCKPHHMVQDLLFYLESGTDGANGKVYSFWHDLLELWPVYGGGNKHGF